MRVIDELGRVVIPLEYRRQLGWEGKDAIEMVVSNDTLILKKAVDSCNFCKSTAGLVKIGNACICRECRDRLHTTKDGDVLYSEKVD